MTYNPSPTPGGNKSSLDWWRSHYKSLVAGVMAYSYYVAAALMAGAEFPKFLRDHLFDGLAPAVLVGILVDFYPRANPTTAFGKIRRPATMMLIVFFIPGAVIFGLIGMAAIFSSGANDYVLPVIFAAFWGGWTVPLAYMAQVLAPDDNTSIGETRWSRTKWWFKKRPKPGTTPEATEHIDSHAVPTVGEAGAN